MTESLTKTYEDFIKKQDDSGDLQAAIDQGMAELKAGKGEPLDMEAIKAEGLRILKARRKS